MVGPLLRLKRPLAPGRARFAELIELETNLTLDHAVVTFFAAPNSYTTEDVVEIGAHGSPILMEYRWKRESTSLKTILNFCQIAKSLSG